LAEAGIVGPPRAFDDPDGLWEKVTGRFAFEGLGQPVDGLSAPERVTHKYFPTFTESQGVIAMALGARKEIGVTEVESIVLNVTDVAWRQGAGHETDGSDKWSPRTEYSASRSFPYLVARALLDGAVTPATFSRSKIGDPSIRPLMTRVRVKENKAFSERRRLRKEENAELEINLSDGRTLRNSSIYPPGHPKVPMTDLDVLEKFTRSTLSVLQRPETEELRELVLNLPEEQDLDRMTALFRKFHRGKASGQR
jgi:2-methylcitrate dehydratase